jgi:hypothetical protein
MLQIPSHLDRHPGLTSNFQDELTADRQNMEQEDNDIVRWLESPNGAKQMGNTLSVTL